MDHLVKNFSNLKRNSDLIRIIKALIYTSISIPSKKYYYQIAIFNLRSELARQILNDGCHFQRNPKIHIQVLMDLLDIRVILNSAKKNIFFDKNNTSFVRDKYNILRMGDVNIATNRKAARCFFYYFFHVLS